MQKRIILFLVMAVMIVLLCKVTKKITEHSSDIIPRSYIRSVESKEPQVISFPKKRNLGAEINRNNAQFNMPDSRNLLPTDVYKFEPDTTYQQEIKKIHDLGNNLSRSQILSE